VTPSGRLPQKRSDTNQRKGILEWGYVIFLLVFFERKNKFKKSSQSKILFRLMANTYTCVLCTHIRINVCRELVHLDSSGLPGVSSWPLGSQPSTPSVQCVCVCAYTVTHIHPHILPPALKIEETQTTTLSFLLSKNNPPRHVHRLAEPPHPCFPNAKWTDCT